MSDIAANAQQPPTSVEPAPQAAPVITPQDVTPPGSGESVSDIEKYQAERLAFLANPDEPEAEPVVTPPVEATPPPAETPLEEGEIEVETEPTGETPPEGKPPRYRFTPTDGVEAVAFKMVAEAKKAGKTLSMKDAIAQTESLPAFKEAAARATQPAPTLPGPEADYDQVIAYLKTAQPTTQEEASNLIALCRSKRKTAMAQDLNMEAAAEFDDILIDLNAHQGAITNRQAQARQGQINEFNNRSVASQQQAVDLYPDVTRGDSALVAEMLRLDKVLKDSGNELYHSADKPLKLTQMAANNLGIAPGAKPAPAAASPKPVAPKRPVQPPFANGGARTTSAPTTQGQLEEALNAINSVEALEAAKLAMK